MDSSSVCGIVIPHAIPNPATPFRCGEFSFEDITALPGAVSALNSTAVVDPLPLDLSGSQMECFSGGISPSASVDSVMLCVIGECI